MTSPAHRQYLAVKQRYPDAIVLFRMGDFYEMFGKDAETGASALHITLTSREFARGERVPMAGIPHHALQGYLKRFMQHGLKVAICEQLTEAGKGLVERDVVRVVTPGTLVEPELLEEGENNYLAAVNKWKDKFGLAYVDVTTGEFAVCEFEGMEAVSALEAELLRLAPSETLVPSLDPGVQLTGHVTVHDDFRFDPETANEALCRQFGVQSMEGFGCAELKAAVGAAGAIVSYVEQSNKKLLAFLKGLRTYQVSSFMALDRYTRRNLELLESVRGGAKHTLLGVLDETKTAMGGRLLRRMIGQPLLDVEVLNERLDAVAELADLTILRTELRGELAHTIDLERVSARICQGVALPQELLALAASLGKLHMVRSLLSGAKAAQLTEIHEDIDPCDEIAELIERAVAALEMKSGTRAAAPGTQILIKPGFSPELDELRDSIRESRTWIAGLEGAEQQRTGIKSLKVGYNKVFGYYLEVSNSNRAAVPQDYVRKQTLVNAERFITPELKEHEARILQAEDRITSLERRVFADLLETIAADEERLFKTANALGLLDVYRSLADVASKHSYVRPELAADDWIEIEEGRHPVVELTLDREMFVANDCSLDTSEHQVLIITGPNMGGKSTYLRQVALIVLMAQIGSFVPAAGAHIGLVDRIFTRVGAQDDIAAGQSTFMVEMVETANILNHATKRSLLILDEIGRGTSTYDGLAIARAVVEHVHDRIGARTLFATHYHELTSLADRFPRIHNASVAVAEDSGTVLFLHRLIPGGADRSYGIHVARLAGLPTSVTARAEEALIDLQATSANGRRERKRPAQQPTLFGGGDEGKAKEVVEEMLALDLENTTGVQALQELMRLQEKAKGS